jgi:hypothetical protein
VDADEFWKRSICHEAGHIVIAFNMGLTVDSVRLDKRLLATHISNLDAPEMIGDRQHIFLAGGIAGELSVFGDYDELGAYSDQEKIHNRGGAGILKYSTTARNILHENEACFSLLRQKLSQSWTAAASAAQFEDDPDTFEILSVIEIQEILQACRRICTGLIKL